MHYYCLQECRLQCVCHLLNHGHLKVLWFSLLWVLPSHLHLLLYIKVPFILNFAATFLDTAIRISLISFLISDFLPVPPSTTLPRRHGGHHSHHHRHVKPVVTAPSPSDEQSNIWQLEFQVLCKVLLNLR